MSDRELLQLAAKAADLHGDMDGELVVAATRRAIVRAAAEIGRNMK